MTDFNEILNDRGRGALDKKMGIEITEASPQRLVGRMPVEGNTQPIGLLHGGARPSARHDIHWPRPAIDLRQPVRASPGHSPPSVA